MIIVPDTQLERLKGRIMLRDVTLDEVWDYIRLNHAPIQQEPEAFITAQDLANFWLMHDWWEPVPDKPAKLPTPEIRHLCWFINRPPMTFNDAMMEFSAKCVEHCEQAGLNPANPGETAAERRKRKNRERMAKVRGNLPVPEKVIKHDPVLAARVREIEEEIQRVKVAGEAQAEVANEETKRLLEAMHAASAHRKAIEADYKGRIAELRTEILNLTAKQ